MGAWREFETFIKFPDNEIMGTQGEYHKAKSSIDLSQIVSFYESSHEPTNTVGVGVDFIGMTGAFIIIEYEDFKKIINAFV